jgi:hypothetical protein
MKRSKIGFVASLALALVITVSLLVGNQVAKATTCPSPPCWQHISSPNVGTSHNLLLGVYAVSTKSIWAVGRYHDNNSHYQTLIEHGTLDGSGNYNFAVVTSTNPGPGATLNAVANARNDLFATDVWAVGFYTDTTPVTNTLIEQYHNGSWSTATSPNVSGSSSNVLNGVAGDKSNDYWAVGYYYDPISQTNKTLIEHYAGNSPSWSIVSSANHGTSYDNYLTSVTVVSSTLAWAAGYYNNSGVNHPLLLQWDGSNWRDHTADLPTVPATWLNAISFNGQSGWAVGLGTGGKASLAYSHDPLTGWSSKPPVDRELNGVDTIASNSAWVVGWHGYGNPEIPSSDYWDGTQWTQYLPDLVGQDGDQPNAVSALSSNDVWMVGVSINFDLPLATYIEHFN